MITLRITIWEQDSEHVVISCNPEEQNPTNDEIAAKKAIIQELTKLLNQIAPGSQIKALS